LALHVASTLVEILDVGDAERTTAVVVALEFGDSSGCLLLAGHLDHAGAAGASVWLVLDLRLLDLTDCDEEFDEIIVARAPRELLRVLAVMSSVRAVKILTLRT
jgi:hypothetical protein